jgi:hypothetical protein
MQAEIGEQIFCDKEQRSEGISSLKSTGKIFRPFSCFVVAIASFLEDPQTPGEKEVCFFHSL